ncbi:hypothetical protein AKG07_08840 [Microbacterium sp. CGR1]|uniref:hypothetical protein n=1 Tax=Microbacterium sp. CGR1 TaxID=1696072 RepID=UPI00069F6AF6|nr:hypothetical protein [Microbacterium sp. CGR1]AKV86390.1 hypothetical protein AKG07_08840 [Microbacterium sp. CGR1]
MTAQTPALIPYRVFSLAELESFAEIREQVHASLAAFDCERSSHLQDFARGKVHNWESHGHSRTYVLVTVDDERAYDVAAFFTIGMATLDLREASKTLRTRLSGNIPIEQTGAFSIAELARHDRYSREQLPGTVLLDEAKTIVKLARGLIGGRFLVVDAQRSVFDALYAPAGFKEIRLAASPAGMEEAEFITACCVIKDW